MSIDKFGQQGIGNYYTFDYYENKEINPQQKTEDNKSSIFSRNDKKSWIKQYREETGATKKEANKAFADQFEEINKMSHKEARKWLNNYRKENNCSKKEAKAAFKEYFGYNVPLSTGAKIFRACSTLNPITWLASVVDTGITDGKLGMNKFYFDKGNNDGVYKRKEPTAYDNFDKTMNKEANKIPEHDLTDKSSKILTNTFSDGESYYVLENGTYQKVSKDKYHTTRELYELNYELKRIKNLD